ncbi:MAG: hypothetical protein ACI959_000856 [Limisphaerales bacterium]|jgi:hypothetical protein
MLSSTTLSTSDFYTGAFHSEFGNATSGVFDLNFRNGNNEKREHSLMIGLLGVEFGSEGYFTKSSKASYLINYRYSTLALLNTFLAPVGDVLPKYSDLSFKINVPTANAGTFSIFGLGGSNEAFEEPEADSTAWQSYYDREGFVENQQMGVVEIGHRYLLSDRTWLRTVASASYEKYTDRYYELIPEQNYSQFVNDSTLFENYLYRGSIALTHKFNAKNTIKTGLIYSYKGYTFDYQSIEDSVWVSWLDGKGALSSY